MQETIMGINFGQEFLEKKESHDKKNHVEEMTAQRYAEEKEVYFSEEEDDDLNEILATIEKQEDFSFTDEEMDESDYEVYAILNQTHDADKYFHYDGEEDVIIRSEIDEDALRVNLSYLQ